MKSNDEKPAAPPASGTVTDPRASGEPQPPLSDLRPLYRAALDLWKAAPWEWMSDTDLFKARFKHSV